MCELFAVRFASARPRSPLMRPVLAMERFGITGLGWGFAWEQAGRIRCMKGLGTLQEDLSAQGVLEGVSSDRFLVHPRRPSRLTTVSLEDAQPFVLENGSWAFAHNGRFVRAQDQRDLFRDTLQGRGDSEVGFRLVECKCVDGALPQPPLEAVNGELGGTANMVLIPASGPTVDYTGHPMNPFWSFDLEDGRAAATSLHSADDNLSTLCFPGGTRIAALGERAVVSLETEPPPTDDAGP
jgi:hypothetical protein